MKNQEKFEADVCEHCGQTTNYHLRLDRGSAHFMIALASAVKRLGRNRVHLQKEMEGKPEDFDGYQAMLSAGYMTSRMEGNSSRPRRHGLIAHAVRSDGTSHAGEYLITRKGAAFLHGEPIELTAVVSKTTGHQTGYWEPDGFGVIKEILKKEPYWWGELTKMHVSEDSDQISFLD